MSNYGGYKKGDTLLAYRARNPDWQVKLEARKSRKATGGTMLVGTVKSFQKTLRNGAHATGYLYRNELGQVRIISAVDAARIDSSILATQPKKMKITLKKKAPKVEGSGYASYGNGRRAYKNFL